MQQTNNFNLKLPEYTDVPDITDINDNFTTLDEEVAKEASATQSGRLSATDKILVDVQNTLHINTSETDAYVLAIDGITSMSQLLGVSIHFKATVANSGAATLNINALGVYNLSKDVSAALETGDILANGIVTAMWDGTRYQVMNISNGVTKNGVQTLSNKTLASPAMTGTPTAPTAAAGTNTTQVASTAFVNSEIANERPFEATASNIKMDGVQSVGSLSTVARGDHTHPTDTSRAPLASPALSGIPTAPTPATDTNTTQIATTAYVQSNLQEIPGKNYLINGNFDVWQDGITFNGTNYYSSDQWYHVTENSETGIIALMDYNVPLGFGFKKSLRFGSSNSLNRTFLIHPIEDVRTLANQTATLSFYAKADAPIEFVGYFDQIFDGSEGVSTPTQKVYLTSNWQRYELTFDIPSVDDKTIGANSRMNLVLTQALSTIGINITGAKLESGNKATPVGIERYIDVLKDCQRFLFKSYTSSVSTAFGYVSGYAVSNYLLTTIIQFPVQMRAAPNVVIFNNDIANQLRCTTTNVVTNIVSPVITCNNNSISYIYDAESSPFTTGVAYDFDIVANARF